MNSWHVQQLKFAFGIGGFMSFYGIVTAIVLFGDKVGINVPQKGVVIAVVLLTIPFALLIGYVSARRAKKKEEKAKAEAEAKAGEKTEAEKPAEKSVPTAADNGDFRAGTEEVVQFLKNSNLGVGGKEAVYALPWYIVAGTTKSGKSSLVIGSDLTFQNLPSQRQSEQKIVRPTKAVDWRVTNDAVFVDTAGHFQAESVDQSEWTALLDTIKKYRSNRPLDGFILTVSTEKILNGDEREIEEMAKNLRAKLDEAMQKLKVRFPIYLVFTKADAIEGFRDSFSNSKQEGKNLVWGATIPLEKSENGQALFDSEFELLQNSIMKRRLMRLSAPFPPVRQLRIFNFPLHFGAARRKLGAFVSTLFRPNPFSENPFLRGFYFTASPIAPARQGGVQTVGQTYFTERLFRDVILRDKDLVKTFLEQRQKPPILGWLLTLFGAFLTLLFLTLATISLFNNKGLLEDASNKGKTVLEMVERDKAFANLLDKKPEETENEIKTIDNLRLELERLDDYERNGVPWLLFGKNRPILGWGLYSGSRLYRENLLPIYFNAVERRFKNPAVNKIREELRQFAESNPAANPGKLTPEEEKNLEEKYNLLMAFLMLTGEYKGKLLNNEAQLTNILKPYWIKESKTPANLQAMAEDILIFWAKQNDRDGDPRTSFPRIPYDDETKILVTKVRKKLAELYPAPNRYYKTRAAEVSQQVDKNFGSTKVETMLSRNSVSSSFVEGKYQIPGAYTIEGFRLMKEKIDEADKKLNEDDWVLGEENKAAASQTGGGEKVRELYYRDYVIHWENLIKDIRVKTYTKNNAKQALEELSAKDSPILIIVQEIARNTTFTEKKKSSSGWWESIKDTISGFFSKKEDLGTDGKSDIEIAFRPANNFIGDGEKETPMSVYVSQMQNINKNFKLEKIDEISVEYAKNRDLPTTFPQLKNSEDKINEKLKIFSEPASAQLVGELLRLPLANLRALFGETGKTELEKLWKDKIRNEAVEAFKGFPFEDSSEADLKKLEAFLNPTESGSFTKFFNETLKADFKETSPGQFTPTDPNKYTQEFVVFLNNLLRLRERLFGKTSATVNYGYSFEIQAPSDVTVTGKVDGEDVEAGKAKNIKFPAGQGKEIGVNIMFSTENSTSSATPTPDPSASPAASPKPTSTPTGIPPLEFKKTWGIFFLFKEGTKTSTSKPYNLTFNRGGKTFTVIISPSGGDLFENNFEVFKSVRNIPEKILK